MDWAAAAEIAAPSRAATARSPIVEAALARIERRDRQLNAFTDVTAERARAGARASTRRARRGRPLGPLAGVPFAVKNLFDVEGLPTRAGSKINRDLPPADARRHR